MQRNRHDADERYTLETVEDGFNGGIKYVALAIFLAFYVGFMGLLVGVLQGVTLAQTVQWTYLLANVLGFFAMTYDRLMVRSQKWAVPDELLHLLEALGGFAGSVFAQQLFAHKTKNAAYQVVFWTIVLFHLAFWTWWFAIGSEWTEKMREKHEHARPVVQVSTDRLF